MNLARKTEERERLVCVCENEFKDSDFLFLFLFFNFNFQCFSLLFFMWDLSLRFGKVKFSALRVEGVIMQLTLCEWVVGVGDWRIGRRGGAHHQLSVNS